VLAATICLALILFSALRRLGGKVPPVDREEIRVLRRLSDRIRSEQGIPFE